MSSVTIAYVQLASQPVENAATTKKFNEALENSRSKISLLSNDNEEQILLDREIELNRYKIHEIYKDTSNYTMLKVNALILLFLSDKPHIGPFTGNISPKGEKVHFAKHFKAFLDVNCIELKIYEYKGNDCCIIC